ncbi:undecaprenyldiphospho-muramoylpentapeptide beta-N-acetylglucosaminyltransferase [Patescibacteria group bacterium]
MDNSKKIKVLLSGGGTGGSVVPLLAIADELGGDDYKYLWFGTKSGPEKKLIDNENIEYHSIISGKLRRYFSFRNFLDPFLILIGFIQSFFLLLFIRPSIIISAGSYVSVPVVWTGWFLGIPVLIHQLDVVPGLANKLMAPVAKKITVTFEASLKDYGHKAVWTGTPIRHVFKQRISKEDARQRLNLKADKPVILILGGGTGSVALNQIILDNLVSLAKISQILHITGLGKNVTQTDQQNLNYQSYEFLEIQDMICAYAAADIVISRCGMGVLTELSYLSKPSIFIPLPSTHQEGNAKVFKDQEAALVLDQNNLTKENFFDQVKKLLSNSELKKHLSQNIYKVIKGGANKQIVSIIKKII